MDCSLDKWAKTALAFIACVLSCFSLVQLFATPWTVVCQAPLSMGFSRQENWNGLPCPPSGDLPDLEPVSLMSPALVDRFFTTRATWEALSFISKSEVFFIHQKEWALESNNGSRKKKVTFSYNIVSFSLRQSFYLTPNLKFLLFPTSLDLQTSIQFWVTGRNLQWGVRSVMSGCVLLASTSSPDLG